MAWEVTKISEIFLQWNPLLKIKLTPTVKILIRLLLEQCDLGMPAHQ